MPATFLNADAIATELEQLRAELAAVQDDPDLARAYGERLSRLGSQITAACERAFVELMADPAA